MISPIQYIGNEVANVDYHHGQLRPLVGAAHYQVLRANRTHPQEAEDLGWTYNHATDAGLLERPLPPGIFE